MWPEDRRNRNGSSMPWSCLFAQRPPATKLVNGKAVLVNGDFYLTRPPPELLSTLGWWAPSLEPLALPALLPTPLPETSLALPEPQPADTEPQPAERPSTDLPPPPLGWWHAQSHRVLWGVTVQACCLLPRKAGWSRRPAWKTGWSGSPPRRQFHIRASTGPFQPWLCRRLHHHQPLETLRSGLQLRSCLHLPGSAWLGSVSMGLLHGSFSGGIS